MTPAPGVASPTEVHLNCDGIEIPFSFTKNGDFNVGFWVKTNGATVNSTGYFSYSYSARSGSGKFFISRTAEGFISDIEVIAEHYETDTVLDSVKLDGSYYLSGPAPQPGPITLSNIIITPMGGTREEPTLMKYGESVKMNFGYGNGTARNVYFFADATGLEYYQASSPYPTGVGTSSAGVGRRRTPGYVENLQINVSNCGRNAHLKEEKLDAGVYWYGPWLELKDLNDDSIIRSGGTAWITGDSPPKMPKLQATITNPDEGVTTTWTLDVTYARPNGVRVPGDQVSLSHTGPSWDIWEDFPDSPAYFGGDAELTCRMGSASPRRIRFKILGKNPEGSFVKSYVMSQAPQYWFAYAIAKVESYTPRASQLRYNQFYRGNGSLIYEKEGFPVFGKDVKGPGGFGLFQITGVRGSGKGDIPTEQLWNWQANVAGGLQVVGDKASQSNASLTKLRAKVAKGKGETTIRSVSMPRDDVDGNSAYPKGQSLIMGGDQTSGVPGAAKVTFQDGAGTAKSQDADIIKRYNSGLFIVWKGKKNSWSFERKRGGDFVSYVDAVSKQIEE